MSRECIIHIGTPKTGTSAMQRFMAQNRSVLARDFDINYWSAFENHSPLSTALCPPEHFNYARDGVFGRNNIEAHRERVISALTETLGNNTNAKFIISAEGFSNVNDAAAAQLKALIEPHFDQFKIVIYTRSPFEWVRSYVQQKFKCGHTFDDIKTATFEDNPDRPFGSRLACADVRARYRYYIEKFAAHFGQDNITVADFSAELTRGNIVDDFFDRVLNIDIAKSSALSHPARVNEAFDHSLAWTLEHINQLSPAILERGGEFHRNPDRASLLVSDFKKRPVRQRFALIGFDFELYAQVIRPDVNWLNDLTGGRIDYRKAAPPSGGPPTTETSHSIAEILHDYALNKETKFFQSQLEQYVRGEKSDSTAGYETLKRLTHKQTQPQFLLRIANQLAQLDRPDEAVIVLRAAEELVSGSEDKQMAKRVAHLMRLYRNQAE